jgi:hypothetical protein
MKTPSPSPIKAVEMVRRIRDGHAAELKGKSAAERLAFYNEQGAKAQAELARLAERIGDAATTAV